MTQRFTTLDDIVALAEFAHRNQQDQAGEPYINHPKRVLKAVQARGARPYVQMAAVLHDVTEDTAFTCGMLLALGVPEAAVELVRLVDRDHSKAKHMRLGLNNMLPRALRPNGAAGEIMVMPSDEFYYHEIRKNPDALLLKDCDIADNTLEWRLSYLSEARQDHLRGKYKRARSFLGLPA